MKLSPYSENAFHHSLENLIRNGNFGEDFLKQSQLPQFNQSNQNGEVCNDNHFLSLWDSIWEVSNSCFISSWS